MRTGLPFTRASTGYSNGLTKILGVSEIANAKSYTRSRLIPAIRTHRAPLGWEAALLEKDFWWTVSWTLVTGITEG